MNGSLPQWWITTCRLLSSSAIASRMISCAKIHTGRPTNPGKGEPRSRFIGEASATHPECRDSLHQSFGVPPSIGEEDPSEFPQRLEERPIGYVIAKGGETTGGCLFKAERPLPWRPSMPRNCTHLLHPTTGHTRSTRALVSAAGFLGFIMGAGGHPARFSALLAAHPPVTPHSYGRARHERDPLHAFTGSPNSGLPPAVRASAGQFWSGTLSGVQLPFANIGKRSPPLSAATPGMWMVAQILSAL